MCDITGLLVCGGEFGASVLQGVLGTCLTMGMTGNFVLESQEAQTLRSSISGKVPVSGSVRRDQAGYLKHLEEKWCPCVLETLPGG